MDNLGPLNLLIVISIAFLVILGISIWVYRDAERRGKSGCLVVIIVLALGGPLGLFAWLVFRPRHEDY